MQFLFSVMYLCGHHESLNFSQLQQIIEMMQRLRIPPVMTQHMLHQEVKFGIFMNRIERPEGL